MSEPSEVWVVVEEIGYASGHGDRDEALGLRVNAGFFLSEMAAERFADEEAGHSLRVVRLGGAHVH